MRLVLSALLALYAVASVVVAQGCSTGGSPVFAQRSRENAPLRSGPYVLSAEGRVVESTARQAAWFGPLQSGIALPSGVHAALIARDFPLEQFDAVVTRVGYLNGGELVFKTELSTEDSRLKPGTRVTARIVLGGETQAVVASAAHL